MAVSWAGYVLKVGEWFARTLFGNVQLERARSGAGEGFPHKFEFLSPFVSESLDLLILGRPSPLISPWKWVKYKASSPPPNLQVPNIKEWLISDGVRQAALEAISARLNGKRVEEAEWLLEERWTDQSGDSKSEAANVVQSLLAFVALSIDRHLSNAQRIILSQQQQTADTILRKIDATELLADAGSHAWVDKEVASQLERVLQRRFLPSHNLAADLATIVDGFETGELRRSSPKTRASVLGWLARAYAMEKKPAEARQAFSKATELSTDYDLTVAEARVVAAEGDVQQAYRILRDRRDEESVTNFFILLMQNEGHKAALRWFVDNEYQPNNFTQAGLINLFEVFSNTAEWGRIDSLAKTIRSDSKPFPALLAISGANLMALAVPEQQRLLLLNSLPFPFATFRFHDDPQSREFLALARERFSAASIQARDLGLEEPARIYDAMSTWLELAHPTTALAAKARIEADLKQPEKGVHLVRLAMEHNIDFAAEPIRSLLLDRHRFGGWADHEIEAALFLSLKEDPPEKVVDFVDQFRSQLEKFFSGGFLRSIEIQALHRIGKAEAAKQLLDASKELFPEADRLRLGALLRSENAEEETNALRKVFEQTQSLGDLQALVHAMHKAKDWQNLTSFARQLFDLTKHVDDALLVVDILQRRQDEDGLFEFMSTIPHVIERSRRLRQTYGWALLSEGHLAEAEVLLSKTPESEWDSNDRNLYVAIVIESGDWDRLGVHVETEWAKRGSRSAEDLLRAARSALEVESGRVAQLLQAAVDASPTDPNVLVAAYSIATEAGLDEEKVNSAWLDRAIKHSSPSGPIRSVSLQELVEMQPDWNRQVSFISDQLSKGTLPLFLAARGLRTTLTGLLLVSLQRNANQTDPRQRMYIPAYHATSVLRGVGEARSVALDVTSIYVLHFLGLLESTISAFDKVVLPAHTLGQMLEERQRIRFHQPSRTREADMIKREVDSHRLKVATNLAPTDPALEQEVGEELAKLVSTAVRDGGVVIRPCPVPKLGSLGVEEANLVNWTSTIFDTHELIGALRKRGHINEAEEQRAVFYLQQHDRRWQPVPRDVPDGPLFIDGLTLSYLWAVRLLHQVCASWNEIYITQETFDRFTELDKAATESADAIKSLDALRRCLHRHLSTGRVVVSKKRKMPGPDDDTKNYPTVSMLAHLPEADVIVIDDRFFNQHATITDVKRGTKPLLSSGNIMTHLRSTGLLDELGWRQARQRLRTSGVGVIPIQPDEILYHLLQVSLSGTEIRESLELRAIRENLTVVAIAQPIDPRTEGAFIAMCLSAIRETIVKIWDGRFDNQEASAKASWVFRLLTRPLNFVRSDLVGSVEESLMQSFASHFAALCLPIQTSDPSRAKAYSAWMDQMLAEDIAAQTPQLVPLVEAKLKEMVGKLVHAKR